MKNNDNILETLGNKNHFNTPDNYFDNFADKIDKKISEIPQDNNQSKKIKFSTLGKVLMYAASITLVIGISLTIYQTTVVENKSAEGIIVAQNEPYNNQEELSIIQYAASNISDEDEAFLLDEFDSEEIEEIIAMN